MTPEEINSRIIYRDGLMLILDKPAGIPVHVGTGGGENLEQYFDALRFGLPKPPALAHRLDRDTSGCLILGRHPKALRKLGHLFSDGLVKKTYWAIVEGKPPTPEGEIDAPLHKLNSKKGWKVIVDERGKKAKTSYKTLAEGNGLTFLELYPATGRTHQIRVHCAHIGCPLLGDFQYGARLANQEMHLHSRQVIVPLYPKKEPIIATCALPELFHKTLNKPELAFNSKDFS